MSLNLRNISKPVEFNDIIFDVISYYKDSEQYTRLTSLALDEFEVDISDLDFLTEYGIKRGIFYFKEVFDNSYLLSCALYVTTKFLNYTYSVLDRKSVV